MVMSRGGRLGIEGAYLEAAVPCEELAEGEGGAVRAADLQQHRLELAPGLAAPGPTVREGGRG